MPFHPWKRIAIAGACFAAVLSAQQAPSGSLSASRFDVVSIRVIPPNTPPTFFPAGFTPFLPGGQYVNPRVDLFGMVAAAFGIEQPELQLIGLPKWAREQSYSVAAKAAPASSALPPAQNKEQVRLMLRAMLEDRFHLKCHTEVRQAQVLHLEVAKGGAKLRAVEAPVPPAEAGRVQMALGNTDGRIIGKKVSVASLAMSLGVLLRTKVVDRTELKGYYDMDVKWREPAAADAGAEEAFGHQGTALLISVLRDELGLRLTSGRGPVEYLVVDHAEEPTEN